MANLLIDKRYIVYLLVAVYWLWAVRMTLLRNHKERENFY